MEGENTINKERVVCRDCGHSTPVDFGLARCLMCGSFNVRIEERLTTITPERSPLEHQTDNLHR